MTTVERGGNQDVKCLGLLVETQAERWNLLLYGKVVLSEEPHATDASRFVTGLPFARLILGLPAPLGDTMASR